MGRRREKNCVTIDLKYIREEKKKKKVNNQKFPKPPDQPHARTHVTHWWQNRLVAIFFFWLLLCGWFAIVENARRPVLLSPIDNKINQGGEGARGRRRRGEEGRNPVNGLGKKHVALVSIFGFLCYDTLVVV